VPRYTKLNKKVSSRRIDWKKAFDIKKRVLHLSRELSLEWVNNSSVYCFRSTGANTRAFARIWGLPRIWQLALNLKPSYIIEVISEKFDKLNEKEKDKVLLHEIAHIPKNFSGSLVPHIRRGKRNFNDKVNSLISKYIRSF